MKDTQIVFSSSSDCSGYSSCSRNYILALNENGYDVKFDRTIISNNINGYGVNQDIYKKLYEKSYNNKYVRIHHSVPDRFYIDKNAILNIGYTVSETYKIPENWPYLCNKMDAIFTASSFCRDIFLKNGVTVPIFVIPHCLNKNIWNRKVKPLIFKNNQFENKFFFAGDTTDRKGIFELLDVWNEIPKNDNCSLTIKGYYNSFSQDDQSKLKEKIKSKLNNKDINPVFFYGHCLNDNLIPRFYKSFDYNISPHKGEGFGLIPFESIFLGVPTIVTNATGTQEFTNINNSLLIDVDGYEFASDELCKVNPEYRDCEFIKISKNSLKNIITDICNNEIKFKIKNEYYNDFVNTYSYEPISKKIIESIQELL